MFQILGMLDKLGAGIFYGIVSGIYSTVAKIYDILLQIVESPSDMFITINLDNILDTAYVAAGVFMLFRVVIAMIQMFLDPDKLTDSNAGAGKLITRVVTVIILLIALKPTGFVLGDNGLFRQIEDAMLASDGLISNIINATSNLDESNEDLKENNYVYNGDEPSNNFNTMNFSHYLYEDVSAASKKLTCYYLKVYSHTKKVDGNKVDHSMTINKVYKIEFYNNNEDGKDGHLNCSGGVCKYSYTVRDGTRIAGDDENGYYSSLDGNISMGDAFSGSFPNKCPQYLQEKTSGGTHYAAMKKHPVKNDVSVCHGTQGLPGKESKCENIGIMGGYSTFDKLRNVVSSLQLRTTGQSYSVRSTHPWISKLTNTSKNEEDAGAKTYLHGIHKDAIKFAQTTAGTFMDCSGDTECKDAKDEMFKSSAANADIIDYIADDTMTLDWFTAAIVGIALIVYLLILCIDVIVRKLKLILMEVISPIPIVGYIDPKDKMFMTWFKMYMSIYADLFLKLIAMAFLVNLLKWDNLNYLFEDSGLLVKFFYIVAILVFVKVVPSMLSKIFGLESNGGSFKDILGMAKGAAGFGAGAAIGGAVGFATGGVGGLLRGAARGAGAGMKGDFTGGAAKTAAYNRNLKAARASGSTALGRALTNLGLNSYEDQKRKIADEKADLAEAKANEMNQLQNRKNENANILSNIKGFEDKVESNLLDKSVYDNFKIKDDWSQEQKEAAMYTQYKVFAYRKAIADLSSAEASGDSQAIYEAGVKLSSAKKAALDQTKEWEAAYGTDQKAQAYLQNLDSDIVNKGFEKGIDATKKSIDAENIALNSKISDLEIKYTEKQQSIEAKERALEASSSKANYDAVNNLKGK